MSKNGKITLIAAGAGFALCLAARIAVIIFFTDMKSGFLYGGNEIWCNILLYAGVLAAGIAAFVLTKNEPVSVNPSEKSCLVIGFSTLLAAICAGYEGLAETSALTPSVFLIIMDFAWAVYMAALAFTLLYEKSFSPALGFCYSIIGVYCVGRGIYSFMNRMAITTVPEYLAEVLGMVLCACFFAMFAKLVSGNGEKRTMQGTCLFGVGAGALTLSGSLGIMLAKLFAPADIAERITASSRTAEAYYQSKQGAFAYMMTFTPYVNMALGLLVAVGVAAALKSVKSDKQ